MQAFTTHLALGQAGTLTLTADAGPAAVVANVGGGGALTVDRNPTLWYPRLTASPGHWLEVNSGALAPTTDNAIVLGYTANRWYAVYAVAGAINTSSREVKEGITPLDPARAMEAVPEHGGGDLRLLAPTRGPEWYDLPDDPEQAEAVLAQRLTAAPLEAAARHQHGFIAEDCDPLFLVGEGQTSPGSSIGVLLAALQNIDSRLAALEGA